MQSKSLHHLHCLQNMTWPIISLFGSTPLNKFPLSFCSEGGSHMTITYDALDLTVQEHPDSDIWWYSLETCSNLFNSGRPLELTSGGYWSMYSPRKRKVRILLECFLVKQECIPVGCLPPARLPYPVVSGCRPPKLRLRAVNISNVKLRISKQ